MDTNRRDFIKGAATVMAALPTFSVLSQDDPAGVDADPINVAIIGFGCMGEVLCNAAVKIPGVRVTAVCDIWKLGRDKGRAFLRGMKHNANVKAYEDYREMLEKEGKGIDVVIVATPDWMHAEHANACLRAGKHVYCEAPMAHRLEDAKSMVLAQRETGKVLQVGHHRRSLPRYIHAVDRVIREAGMLGRIHHAYAQRDCFRASFMTCRERIHIPPETLRQYGYENMEQFLNWGWFAKHGGGPMLIRGSHQVDVFLWALGGIPVSVTAVGGNDYYGREMNDAVTAVYEFKAGDGKVCRAQFQMIPGSYRGGNHEQFMGENGLLTLSARFDAGANVVQRRPDLLTSSLPSKDEWDAFIQKGLVRPSPRRIPTALHVASPSLQCVWVGPTLFCDDEGWVQVEGGGHDYNFYPLPMTPGEARESGLGSHLGNFFDAVRQNNSGLLTCPAEVAYRAMVATLAAGESIAKRQTITFKPEDFRV